MSLVGTTELSQLRADRDALNLQLSSSLMHLDFLGVTPQEMRGLLDLSASQLGQDVFAYLASGKKTSGFFVEFGAGDGVSLSNTLMLERHFGWTGILAEPLAHYHESIRRERVAVLDGDCVWRETGRIVNLVSAGYLSTIEEYRFADHHGRKRAARRSIAVKTVSLWDLLERNNAPRTIDFLSIDTEGSELEILKAFPFGEKYSIRSIACEHNYSAGREAIQDLLLAHNYRLLDPVLSVHDDWFVLENQ